MTYLVRYWNLVSGRTVTLAEWSTLEEAKDNADLYHEIEMRYNPKSYFKIVVIDTSMKPEEVVYEVQ